MPNEPHVVFYFYKAVILDIRWFAREALLSTLVFAFDMIPAAIVDLY